MTTPQQALDNLRQYPQTKNIAAYIAAAEESMTHPIGSVESVAAAHKLHAIVQSMSASEYRAMHESGGVAMTPTQLAYVQYLEEEENE